MQSHLGRNVAIYFAVAYPGYALAGALVNLIETWGRPRFDYWDDVVAWLVLGWFFPLLFLPAAIAVVGLAAKIPEEWRPFKRRIAVIGLSITMFGLGLAILAKGDLNAFVSPAMVIAGVPAAVYGMLLRLPTLSGVQLRRAADDT